MIAALQRFFEVNTVPVFFVYGLVFFVLGLVVALQSRRHSRLELAQGLGWLAGFGILHGLHEWGDIFIPIQATYLSPPAILILHVLQVMFLALSFGCLFQFGVELLKPRWPRLLILPLIVVVGWTFWFVLPGVAISSDPDAWHVQSSIWARYLIGFPGGVLAALGLRYQADRQIKPLKLQGIYRTLQVAGLAFLAYAVLGGLVVLEGDFFPANRINNESFTAWFVFPPPIYRSLIGLVLAAAVIRALEVFDIELDRLIERLEIEQSLMAERERIGRELHDSTIQTIYTAGLLVESARAKLDQPEIAGRRLERGMEVLNEAIADLRTYISDLHPESASTSLEKGIRGIVEDMRLAGRADIRLEIDLPGDAQLQPGRIHHVLSILREALSNAERHAHAKTILVAAQFDADTLIVRIEDDGTGFSDSRTMNGHGLPNMHERAKLLGGQLRIDTRSGSGVKVELRAPREAEA